MQPKSGHPSDSEIKYTYIDKNPYIDPNKQHYKYNIYQQFKNISIIIKEGRALLINI